MVKKALCVGCDYPSQNPGLSGAVNDSFLIADCLQRSCGFRPEDICILHDVIPGQAKSSQRLVDPSRRPTRVNILQRLRALARGARPGDVLLFSFSGYGLQVDDLRGSAGEGFDEAILPSDFFDGCDGDPAVIPTAEIHDALMGIPHGCSLTVVMDCDHGTSVVDVSGTLDGQLVRGLKQSLCMKQSFCGVERHTTKMQLSEHGGRVWEEGSGPSVNAQPRFQPMVEVANPGGGREPTRQLMSRSTPVAFCYSASGHGETALELQVASCTNGCETLKQHGALSWCFVQALEELRCDCTHAQLRAGIQMHMARLRETCLPSMDQNVLLTFSLPLSDPRSEKVLRPTAACREETPADDPASASRGHRSMRQEASFPQIVPPPPPGFLQKSSSCALPLEAGYLPTPLGSAGLSVWRAAWGGATVALEDDQPSDLGGRLGPPLTRPPDLLSGSSSSSRGPSAPARAPARGLTFDEGPPWEVQAAPLPPTPRQAPATVPKKAESPSTCSGSMHSLSDEETEGSESEEEWTEGVGALLPAGFGAWARRVFSLPRQQEQGGDSLRPSLVPNQRP